MNLKILLGAGAAAVLATAALAQAPADKPRGPRADANADGAVTVSEHRAAVQARFARMDADKDGRVTKAEMEALKAQRLERRSERRSDMFARLDTDKNGQLSEAEFNARERMGRRGGRGGAMHHGRGGRGGEGMMGRMDANGDGVITAAEMDQTATAHFQRMDANKDGSITADERRGQRGHHRGRGRGGDNS